VSRHDQALRNFWSQRGDVERRGLCAACGCSGPIDAQIAELDAARGRGNMRSTAFSSTRSGKRPSRIALATAP